MLTKRGEAFLFPEPRPQPHPFLCGPSPQPPNFHTAPEGLSTHRADPVLLGCPAPLDRVPAPGPGIRGPNYLAPICLPGLYSTTNPLPPVPSGMSFPGNHLLPQDQGQLHGGQPCLCGLPPIKTLDTKAQVSIPGG